MIIGAQLLGEVVSDFSCHRKFLLTLSLVADDPRVREQFMDACTLLWIDLEALDKEVLLVFIEDSPVLLTVYDLIGIKDSLF